MIRLPGPSALSDFRAAQLLEKLQATNPEITSVSARYEHFVDSPPVSKKNLKTMQHLLDYGEPLAHKAVGQSFIIIPRLGTISPWSSKATDIFRNSGLSSVQRVERGVRYSVGSNKKLRDSALAMLSSCAYDQMTEIALSGANESALADMFVQAKPRPVSFIPVLSKGAPALDAVNAELGLALSADEIHYLVSAFKKLKRDPTDAEIMMFSLVNSEHCRHKVFNAQWEIEGKAQSKSLFSMIKNTYDKHSDGIKSAYHDNGAVLSGRIGDFFLPDRDGVYQHNKENADIVIKVETHNHPTAISPIPGAATGSGGEIRDEGATGRGAKPKAGLTGFSVSNLRIPDAVHPWEQSDRAAPHLASSLKIMIEGPIGGSAFNNEFGRPNIFGYFRSFEQELNGTVYGYHKPIMIAGGIGNIRSKYINKHAMKPGDKLIILGGPAMLIGLGGGSASSKIIGANNTELDFASVQRHNPEMQRRAQEVINHCISAKHNPIVSIHDIGAGGYSNAVSEIVHDHGLGVEVDLRSIHNADRSMSPMEIWCNEAQERYVIAVRAKDVRQFEEYCKRERCPYSIIGTATKKQHIRVTDSELKTNVIDASMDTFFGKPPKMVRSYVPAPTQRNPLDLAGIELAVAVKRVLMHPTVGNKSFLITIGDRSVGGMVARDQMVGPWQVPVADVAVTTNSFDGYKGEAMAMGERAPLALHDPASSGRMAIGELITNILAADIAKLSDVKLSANWMAAVGTPGGDQALYETVQAVGESFCPALGLTIPVGKDSTSMKVQWDDKKVISPLSLIVSGFSSVNDVRKTLTPQLCTDIDTVLLAIPLSGTMRMGGSTLAYVYSQSGNECPDAEPTIVKKFFNGINELKRGGIILAYHDRSDGGLLATLCEMAFASRSGLDITTQSDETIKELFNEELGVVIQVASKHQTKVKKIFQDAYCIAKLNSEDTIRISHTGNELFSESRSRLQKWWSHTSYQIARRRDNPDSAQSELDAIATKDPGLSPKLTFEISGGPPSSKLNRPKVAILREQGVNGQVEMAAAFDRAGFEAVDVHLNDLMSGNKQLESFSGLAVCGGFSYGDVLGAGNGWAKSILHNQKLKRQFASFFARPDTFSLGVCNGCQMLAGLKSIIPGAEKWPIFKRNTSEQFEARLTTVKITESPSILLKGMAGSHLLVPTAHGEGRVEYHAGFDSSNVCASYTDNNGSTTETYPFNPNGSPNGATAFTTTDGRATIMMPHPERAFRNVQLSWKPSEWNNEDSPWMQMFYNAYEWTQSSAR